MKNVKLYKWLTVTLMLAISVFCLLYLEKSRNPPPQPSRKPNQKHGGNGQARTPRVLQHPSEKRVFVQRAKFQNIGGDDDDILKNVHTFGKTAYVFFDTSSNGYDVKTDAPSVACALVDENLTLKKP